MKTFLHLVGIAVVCMLVSSCGILCQAGTGTCGMSSEQVELLLHPKAYGEHWVKLVENVGQRREDSWECGAARTILAADHVIFTALQVEAEKLSTEKDEFSARTRLTKAWIECMRSKGYEYRR